MHALIRFSQKLSVIPMTFASVALFALMALTFADVLMRSVFNAPIEAATELIRIGIAVIVFSALPVLSGREGHIAVDLLDKPFAKFNLQRWRDGLISLACGAMLWVPAFRIVDLANRARNYGDQTEYLHIPVYYITMFIAIMTFLSALVLIGRGLMHFFAPQYLGHPDD